MRNIRRRKRRGRSAAACTIELSAKRRCRRRSAGFTSGGKWRILLLHSALFVAGAVVCLVSGVVKVLWKGIAAVTRRNIWPMFVQMRVFMPAGFALIAAAGIGRRLLEYVAEPYGIREVTVNEQNP